MRLPVALGERAPSLAPAAQGAADQVARKIAAVERVRGVGEGVEDVLRSARQGVGAVRGSTFVEEELTEVDGDARVRSQVVPRQVRVPGEGGFAEERIVRETPSAVGYAEPSRGERSSGTV